MRLFTDAGHQKFLDSRERALKETKTMQRFWRQSLTMTAGTAPCNGIIGGAEAMKWL